MEVPALAFASTLNACEHHDTTRQNFSKENYFASYVRASRIDKPKVVMHTSRKPQPRPFPCLLPSISRSRAMVADVAHLFICAGIFPTAFYSQGFAHAISLTQISASTAPWPSRLRSRGRAPAHGCEATPAGGGLTRRLQRPRGRTPRHWPATAC